MNCVVPKMIRPVISRKIEAMPKLRLPNMWIGTIGSLRVNSQGMANSRHRVERTAVVTIVGLDNQSSRWPRSSVTSRKPRKPPTPRKPRTSTFNPPCSALRRSRFRASGSSTNRWTRNSDKAPIGTLIRKHQCQL